MPHPRGHRPSPRACVRSLLLLLVLSGGAVPGTAAESATEFRFGYMPSFHRIRHLVVSAPAGMTEWELVLTPADGREPLARQAGHLPFPASGQTMTVPDLPSGSYALTMTLAGAGPPLAITRTFRRQRFAWEGSTLGRDQVVIPPFTPLQVDPRTGRVECVLRRHTMSGAGLWEQVESEQVALLAAPMQLRLRLGGAVHVATGPGASFSLASGTQVLGAASWHAGPVTGRTRFAYDYDGLMTITLDVDPTPGAVEAMDLVIPMPAREAWLMHPVTDALRSHYAGRIPAGQGTVWDSAAVPRHQLPAPFLPYIWLGGSERGICWIAENDRDWVVDGQRATHDIVRTGEVVSLIIHLIARPSRLMRQRTLVFAVMATPAKPMPTQPAHYRAWWPLPTATTTGVDVTLIGACYYWGAQTPCLQFYPAFRNFSIYDEVARVRAGGQVDPGYPDRWIAQFTAPHYTQELKQECRASVACLLQWARNAPPPRPGSAKSAYLIPYTNARAINWDEEAQTFIDEWSIYDVADPRWSAAVAATTEFPHSHLRPLRETAAACNDLSGVAYEVDPLPSYADMALSYHKKMYETFADGVYWDNFFVLANYNPVSGPAYVDDDGTLHPGVSWFALRDLAKRNAVMQYQMGRRPLAWIHMTNCNVVPALSFGTLLFDWEWRDRGAYAVKDFQDRLGVDDDTSLILAQSTGLQSGNLTVSLDLFRPPPGSGVSREWLVRTGLAVCMPHEIKLPAGDDVHQRVIRLFAAMGYGTPPCAVYRYWDPDPPLTTTGATVKTLVLSRPGKALVFVGSYGPGGDCTLRLDLRRLALRSPTATNAETGLPVRSAGPGFFSIPIRTHDFQIVLIEDLP